MTSNTLGSGIRTRKFQVIGSQIPEQEQKDQVSRRAKVCSANPWLLTEQVPPLSGSLPPSLLGRVQRKPVSAEHDPFLSTSFFPSLSLRDLRTQVAGTFLAHV